jgi:hypothetical protein
MAKGKGNFPRPAPTRGTVRRVTWTWICGLTLLSLVFMVGEGKKSVQKGGRGESIWGCNLDSLPFAVISLPDILFATDTSSEVHSHLPAQRHWLHDDVDTLASDYLGCSEMEDCANPGDRVHVRQPRAPEISDNTSSFERHFEDDFSPTPSWLDELVATQCLVFDTLVTTVSAVTVGAQATANHQLPNMDYKIEIFLVVVDDKARASEASKTIPATIDEETSASCSEIWEGKSG